MRKDFFANKSVLITGGTGTLGKALVKRLVNMPVPPRRIIIYSRDEQKQFQLEKNYPSTQYPMIRYFIGDVRDLERLKRACVGVDYLIHASAMKHVHIAEMNPDECVKTNVIGGQNVIEACIASGVQRVVALSTDKACAPINLYGATKLASDKLFVAANNIKSNAEVRFSVVRYGNVMGSNGSVIPFFLKQKDKGVLPITDKRMTRFNISIEEGVDMVLHAMENAWGGEIFVPKIASYRIMDLANAVSEESKKEVVGIRPGEKMHEEMITESDSHLTYDAGKYYAILPSVIYWEREKWIEAKSAQRVKEGFKYNSGTNEHFETVESLRKLIDIHIK